MDSDSEPVLVIKIRGSVLYFILYYLSMQGALSKQEAHDCETCKSEVTIGAQEERQ
jgi:hypothetical protein